MVYKKIFNTMKKNPGNPNVTKKIIFSAQCGPGFSAPAHGRVWSGEWKWRTLWIPGKIIKVFFDLFSSILIIWSRFISGWFIHYDKGFHWMAIFLSQNLRYFTQIHFLRTFAHHLRMTRNNFCAIFRIVPHHTQQGLRIFALFAQLCAICAYLRNLRTFAQK